MFWIFKFIPDWFWALPLLAGLGGYFVSHLKLIGPHRFVVRAASGVVVALSLFIIGMLYADNKWKQAAAELQAKVQQAEAQSAVVNTVIKEKVVNRLEIVRQRGDDVIKYVDREVVKYDTSCAIPLEFVNAHNQAAEVVK